MFGYRAGAGSQSGLRLPLPRALADGYPEGVVVVM